MRPQRPGWIRRPADGESAGSLSRRLPILLLALVALALGTLAGPESASARRGFRIQVEAETDEAAGQAQAATGASSTRDSLIQEIRRYSRAISVLRDSLELQDLDLEFSEQQKQQVEQSIMEFSDALSEIGRELSRLDLAIEDNRISLTDEAGEGIIINIPENLDEHLGLGLKTISRAILSQLPDTLGLGDEDSWDWRSTFEAPSPPSRQIVHGNLIKVWDDLHVTRTEDVRGNVVVVFGDCQISGRIEGNAVVVFGDLFLDEDAEVTGKVVNVMGRYDQAAEPQVGGVVVVSPFQMGPEGKLDGWLAGGAMSFVLSEVGFLFVVLLSLLTIGIAPEERLISVMRSLRETSLASVGVGFLVWISVTLFSLLLVVILVLTVIGIPVAVLVVLGLALIGVVAISVVATQIGGRFLGTANNAERLSWWRTLVGLLVLHALPFIGAVLGLWEDLLTVSRWFQLVGAVVIFVAFCFGLGALTLSRLGTRKPSA